jgi:hypothetical protein
MGDRAGLGVHSTSRRDYLVNQYINHNNHTNHIDDSRRNHNHDLNFFFHDFDIYNTPSHNNDHNQRTSSVKHNHINDKYHDNDDHNCRTSSDNNASTLHASSNYDD